MADVPSQIRYGKVVGRFVKFVSDTAGDVGTVPDEIPLEGSVTLTPLTTVMRWLTANPPRMAIATPVECQVINGDLCSPEGVPGVWIVATDQPEAFPSLVQWQATFKLTGVSTQPNSIIFNVPGDSQIDIAMTAPVTPDAPTIPVVSHADAVLAQQSGEDAADSAAAAQNSAADAADTLTTVQGLAAAFTNGHAVVVYSAAAPVPPGLPAGTIILRTAT